MNRTRLVGIILLAVGVASPFLIYAYETANRLDISLDVGALPWRTMAGAGALLLIWPPRRKNCRHPKGKAALAGRPSVTNPYRDV